MFTEILKKQSIQYEVQIVNEKIKIIDKQYIVCIDTVQDIKYGIMFGARGLMEKNNNIIKVECTLTRDRHLMSIMSMYEIARNINFITEKIMWPINVFLSQFKDKSYYDEKENNDNSKKTYKTHAELKQMIELDTLKVKSIVLENVFYVPFLKTSTLLNSLLTIKSKPKIFEMLAYLGISIQEANQPFESTSSHTKDTIRNMSSTDVLYKINEVDRLSPIENYYNMVYYISQNKYTDALLSLEKICYKGRRIYECIKTIEHIKMKKVNGLSIIFVKKKINLKNKYFLLNIVYEMVNDKCDALIYDSEEKIIVTHKKMNEIMVSNGCYKVEKNGIRKCLEYLAYIQ